MTELMTVRLAELVSARLSNGPATGKKKAKLVAKVCPALLKELRAQATIC